MNYRLHLELFFIVSLKPSYSEINTPPIDNSTIELRKCIVVIWINPVTVAPRKLIIERSSEELHLDPRRLFFHLLYFKKNITPFGAIFF